MPGSIISHHVDIVVVLGSIVTDEDHPSAS
jgi:hypothetical protein